MAEGRMIKRVIAKSKKMARLSNEKARTLYFMILPHVDSQGRHSADAEDIKATCVPLLPWSIDDVELALVDLHSIGNPGLIVLYMVNGHRYLQITRFRDFNKIRDDREADSLIPAPTRSSSLQLQDNSRTAPGENALSKELINEGINIDGNSLIESSQNNPDLKDKLAKIGIIVKQEPKMPSNEHGTTDVPF